MNRARVAFSAALIATTLATGTALAGQAAQAPPMTSVLAGKKFTPPMRGEATIEFTQPVTKREKNMVVTRILVRNASVGQVGRLTVEETWYDKGGGIVTGGKGTISGLLQPGEIQTIVIETPYDAKMNGNQFKFSHANGAVKPAKVAKLETPSADGEAAKAPAKAPAKK
jgi:hypothetical protein